jgi:hypothetical protein
MNIDRHFRLFGRECLHLMIYENYQGRQVWSLGIETKAGTYSVLLQKYPQGSSLESHVDLDGSNKVLWFLLKKAKSGGLTIVDGPHRSFLFGRVMIFDGGRFSHEVTKVERGSRISLIFQHTVWRPRPILDLDDPAVLETLAKAKP